MTEFHLIGAAIFGGLMFAWFAYIGRREDKRIAIGPLRLPCVKCKAIVEARRAWVRSTFRGDLIRCPLCRHVSIWDLRDSEPKLVRR